jgi:hypothetical protein
LIIGGGAVGFAAIIALATHSRSPEPAASAEPTSTPSVARAQAVRPTAPVVTAIRLVRLRLDPANAQVEIDGVPISANPVDLSPADRIHKITVSAPGFVPSERDVGPNDRIGVMTINLRRQGQPSRPSTSSTKKRQPNLGPIQDDL